MSETLASIEEGEYVVALAHQLQVLCYESARRPAPAIDNSTVWDSPLQMWLKHLATVCVNDLDQNIALTTLMSAGGFTIYISSSCDGCFDYLQDIWRFVQNGATPHSVGSFVLSKIEGRIISLMRLALKPLEEMLNANSDESPMAPEDAGLIEQAIKLIGDGSAPTKRILEAFGFSFSSDEHPPVAASSIMWQKLIERFNANDSLAVPLKRVRDTLFELNGAVQGLFQIPDIVRGRTLLSVIDIPTLGKQLDLPDVSLDNPHYCLPLEAGDWPIENGRIEEAVAALRHCEANGKDIQVHPILALHTYMTMDGMIPDERSWWEIGTSDKVCRGCSNFVDAYYAYYDHYTDNKSLNKARFERNPDPTPFSFPWVAPPEFAKDERAKEGISALFTEYVQCTIQKAGSVHVPEPEYGSDSDSDSDEEVEEGTRNRRKRTALTRTRKEPRTRTSTTQRRRRRKRRT